MKEDLEGEIWKDIVGFEGLYQVSNMGRVYSLPREWICGVCSMNSHSGKILKQYKVSDGYLAVCLYVNNNSKTRKVHQLVAESFLNHTPCGYKLVVDHIDNNPLNNHVSNLQLISNRLNLSKDKKNKTSNYTGVSWKKNNNKWQVGIYINGKYKYVGLFKCELKAHYAYQQALKELERKNP